MHSALVVRLTHPDELELVLAAIDGERPTAVDDPADSGNAPESGVRIFFASADARNRAAAILLDDAGRWPCAPIDVPADDWAERSQAALGAITVGRIVVRPPWSDAADPAGVTVVIQPSMGFGTGHHASTRLCLRLLQQIDVAGRSVMDLGTGSGVLALAAWSLGASPVIAADYDVDALENARENAALNHAAGRVRIQALDLTDRAALSALEPAAFDVVFANLTGAMLQKHADDISRLLTPEGQLIASGMLAAEHRDVLAAFRAAGLKSVDVLTEDEWVAARLSASPTASTTR